MKKIAKRIGTFALCIMLMAGILLSTDSSVEAASRKYVKSLMVAKSSITLLEKSSKKVNATVKVVGSVKKTISVKSSNTKVAQVKAGKTSPKGITPIAINAKKTGSATITVITKAKGKNNKLLTKKIKVTVKAKKTDTSEKPEKPIKPVSKVVKWTVTEEAFEGSYSVEEGEGEDKKVVNYPINLMRKYVSFAPWPTTNEQVQYVIKNCDDPYVIAALYVVALDNYEYNGRGNYSGVTYQMLESLMNGAGAMTGSDYVLNNFQKESLVEYGTKKCPVTGGESVLASSFASRAYLKGATPYNGYTPEGGLSDKTKWQIIVDQYPYCFDQVNEVKKYITLCPRKYTEEQETEGSEPVPNEHSQSVRIGFRWNGSKRVWLPTDYVKLNTDPGSSALVPFDIKTSVLFTNNYKAPQLDQGW